MVFLMVVGSMAQNGYSSYRQDQAVLNNFNVPPGDSSFVHNTYDENGKVRVFDRFLNVFMKF